MAYSPMAAAFSTSFSSSMTWRLARAAAMARSFWPKVLEWTTQRSMESKTHFMISGRVTTAPTGTKPPERALATQRMSGSTPSKCW